MKFFYVLSLSVLFVFGQASAQNSIPGISNLNIGSPANRAGTIYVNNIDASGNAKIGGNGTAPKPSQPIEDGTSPGSRTSAITEKTKIESSRLEGDVKL